MKREFKVGDKVRIRQWDDMAKEFGINDIGYIQTRCSFTTKMKHLCGRVATITFISGKGVELDFEDKSGDVCWIYSIDMLEPIFFTKADLKPTDIVKYRNGSYNMVLANRLSEDGLGMFIITSSGVGICNGYLSDVKEDLTYHEMHSRDIIAVYGEPISLNAEKLSSYFRHGITTTLPPLIWEREEPKVKELTAAEAAVLLKDKFAEFDEVKIVM